MAEERHGVPWLERKLGLDVCTWINRYLIVIDRYIVVFCTSGYVWLFYTLVKRYTKRGEDM